MGTKCSSGTLVEMWTKCSSGAQAFCARFHPPLARTPFASICDGERIRLSQLPGPSGTRYRVHRGFRLETHPWSSDEDCSDIDLARPAGALGAADAFALSTCSHCHLQWNSRGITIQGENIKRPPRPYPPIDMAPLSCMPRLRTARVHQCMVDHAARFQSLFHGDTAWGFARETVVHEG